MNTKHYTHCPECGAKWIGDPIPLENRVNYRPPYFYYFLQLYYLKCIVIDLCKKK